MATSDHVWVVILAGGVGSRFWPASTPERPKQLLPLASERPLVVDAVQRARAVAPDERIRILAGAHLAEAFRTVLPDLPDACYWIEPRAKGTAPVLAWAAWKLVAADPEAIMVSLHADHLIHPTAALGETVASAIEVARRDGLLVTVAARPDRIEPGFGHIEKGEPLPAAGVAAAARVKAFHEKPDADTARRYVEEGHLWNTGIFVWRAATFLAEIAEHAPDLSVALDRISEGDEAFFAAAPSGVVDRAVLEPSRRVATVEATFAWDDVGSWEALARTRAADEAGNVVVGEARLVDSTGNIVFSEGGEVVLIDTHDAIVVKTSERVAVLPRSAAPGLKEMIARLGGA